MAVIIPGEKVAATFIRRPNRFQAEVEIDGEREIVHVPNTGRMDEMLHPGTPVVLERSDNPKRKHRYGLRFVNKNGHWICIHSALANRVFRDAVESGRIDWVEGPIRSEVKVGDSRMDFRIDANPPTWVEVKCVTYEENGVAMFPDAPTVRGQKHVDELIRAVTEGDKGVIVFVAFMDFVHRFTPHTAIDPVLAEKMGQARNHGICIHAYRCSITFDAIEVVDEIPVDL
ncbi:DNA/RNA nuclease SfsA [Desmospora profundinema]|uniref:Sugar fermentation stimulation protein homolog n=1 Tax=Desmospora profundinema TaxID=1571184 RepID=A0ABU1IQ62_9BACL|nr:DNA/RNA nuclease SfsA [Desmospora profundinema]MDR6226269.1 sugar fermentation stimulation protein A [Desmospora profundinema]